jgi:hypothetical protein
MPSLSNGAAGDVYKEVSRSIASRWRRRFPIGPRRCVIFFPKSGRTWLRVMLDDLRVSAEYTHKSGDDTKGLHFDQLRISVPDSHRNVILVRDPRYTTVSGYYHATRRLRLYSGSISEFIRDPRYGLEKCVRFDLIWAEAAGTREDMMIVSYEAMREDTANCLHNMLHFFGCRRSAQSVRAVVLRNEFDIMRKREIAGEIAPRYKSRLGGTDPEDLLSLKRRKGRVGGYRDELCAKDVKYCDSILENLEYFTRLGIAPHDARLRKQPSSLSFSSIPMSGAAANALNVSAMGKHVPV